MLPKPKNSVTVGANKNRVFQRETNRSLVPHTLTKKPATATTTTTPKTLSINPKTKEEISTTANNSKNESDEEEEEEEVVSGNSFFSLGDNKQVSQSLLSSVSNQVVENRRTITTTTSKSPIETIQTMNKMTENETGTAQKVPDNSLQHLETQSSVAMNKVSKGAKKDNSFFANLFNNKTAQQKPKSTDRADVNKDGRATVSLSNNEEVKEHLPTSYGVSAPYGKSGNSSSSSVTAPYGNTSNNATAPYGSGGTSNVTAPYGSSNSNNVTRPYGSNSNSVTAPYGDSGGGSSNVTAPYGSYGNPSQHSHGYPSQPPTENFFSYSHGTTQHQPQHVSNVHYFFNSKCATTFLFFKTTLT